MTTAHRPTLKAAVATSGGIMQGGYFSGGQISAQTAVRALPSHTKLKLRQPGQATDAELRRRNLRAELEARERAHFDKVRKERAAAGGAGALAAIEDAATASLAIGDAPRDSGGGGGGAAASSAGGRAPRVGVAAADDKDDEELALYDDADDSDDTSSSSDSDDDSDDDDDTAALMRELEKIKKERAEEQARKEVEAKEAAEAEAKAAVLAGNPLLATGKPTAGSAIVKRRWDDDVVFRNQARNEPKVKKRFINDTIRSDFHRSFLNKYVK